MATASVLDSLASSDLYGADGRSIGSAIETKSTDPGTKTKTTAIRGTAIDNDQRDDC